MSAVIYIEGGGDRDENLARLFRRSWKKFFAAAGLEGRMPKVVSNVLDNLAAGLSPDEITKSYPSITRESIQAALCYAAALAKRTGDVAVEVTPMRFKHDTFRSKGVNP